MKFTGTKTTSQKFNRCCKCGRFLERPLLIKGEPGNQNQNLSGWQAHLDWAD